MKNFIKLTVVIVLLGMAVGYASAQNYGIIPTPKDVSKDGGDIVPTYKNVGDFFVWDNPALVFDKINKGVTNKDILVAEYQRLLGKKADVLDKKPNDGSRRTITFRKSTWKGMPAKPDIYMLDIREREICITSPTDAGLFYGLQSLVQLYRFNYRAYFENWQYVKIPCVLITDYADYQYRGWMIDISRGPIPTMDYLKRQIQTMAEFKLNALTLYTEHTFVSKAFDYAPADGITAEQVRELQDFAKDYYIEVIGNQQCFAHYEKILNNPKYEYLADTKFNLNPGIPETYDFLRKLLKEEADAYNSPLFNINCDETETLGTGNAAEYVNKIGATEAYILHIKKVYDILKSYGKTTMMWADIVLKEKEIQKQLPKDIKMLVWCYDAIDSFDDMIIPIKEAGYDFWVVPGVSMWSTIFPCINYYEKNIANFARDGHRFGASGLLNTAWNDSGEASLNSVWHAMVWGAEMSWAPTVETDVAKAEKERSERLATFDTNFNFQFFHFYNDVNIIADFLRDVSRYKTSAIGSLYYNSSIWNYNPWFFSPETLSEKNLQTIKRERFNLVKTIELLKLILSEEDQYQNTEIIYNAVHTATRMLINLNMKRSQYNLYDAYKTSGAISEKQYNTIRTNIRDLVTAITALKTDYTRIWNESYRPYWLDINMAKYDRLIEQIETIPEHVIIKTALKDNKAELTLGTIFNNLPIHYTLDGTEPNSQSPVYKSPITLTETKTVKTLIINKAGKEVRDATQIMIHKGYGHLTEVVGKYSTHRPEYSGGGKFALADGETGSNNYRDGKWQGYEGQDVELIYHWPEATDISSVTVHYMHNFGSWILAPTDIEIYVKEGDEYKLAASQHFNVEQVQGSNFGDDQKKDHKVREHTLDGLKIHTSDLKVVVRNPGKLPKEHYAHGYDSYLFMDEIIIR